jgi:tetratricopeptide (TPR) repeat protein
LTCGRTALAVLSGMGGIGKTQTAVQYAYRHRPELEIVWWLRAEEAATLLEDYVALAGPLELAEAGGAEVAKVAAAVRGELSRRGRWLLVFDNAAGPDSVRSLLPMGGTGRVLITSRNPNWHLAMPLNVPVLSRETAIDFLLDQTKQHDRSVADAVADELGYLPLALAQAAAYMVATGISLAGYLDLWRQRRLELWAEQEPPEGYNGTLGTLLATDRLRDSDPIAVDLLCLCAFLAPDAIPRRLLTEHHVDLPADLGSAVADPLRFNRVVAALRRYSLVEATSDALTFHRLIQAAARDALPDRERRRWIGAAVTLMRKGFPFDQIDSSTWAPSGALLSHALTAADHANVALPRAAALALRQLLSRTAEFLANRAEFKQAVVGFKRALKLAQKERALKRAQKALDSIDVEIAEYHNNLGFTERRQGHLPGAREHFERALEIDVAVFRKEPRLTQLMAHLHHMLHHGLAESISNFIPEISSDQPTLELSKVAFHVCNLGELLREQRDPRAEGFLMLALRIVEAIHEPDHRTAAIPLNHLGDLLFEKGQFPEAKAHFERALAILSAPEIVGRASQSGDARRATALLGLGRILQQQGDLKEAKTRLEKALEINEKSYHPGHPEVARILETLGGVLRQLGDDAGAKSHFERALGIRKRFLEPQHPDTLVVREDLAQLERDSKH